MMYDEEAASPRWKLNPKNFGPNIKSRKFLGSGEGKNYGRSGFRKQQIYFRPKSVAKFYYFNSDITARLHKIAMLLCIANYKVQKCAIQYQVHKVHNIRFNIQIPAIKHYKIQYMLMKPERGDGGENVVGNVEDSTGQKM